MVPFKVPNFHDLIERLENLSNLISKCSNLFDLYAHRHLSDSLTLFSVKSLFSVYEKMTQKMEFSRV